MNDSNADPKNLTETGENQTSFDMSSKNCLDPNQKEDPAGAAFVDNISTYLMQELEINDLNPDPKSVLKTDEVPADCPKTSQYQKPLGRYKTKTLDSALDSTVTRILPKLKKNMSDPKKLKCVLYSHAPLMRADIAIPVAQSNKMKKLMKIIYKKLKSKHDENQKNVYNSLCTIANELAALPLIPGRWGSPKETKLYSQVICLFAKFLECLNETLFA